MSDEATATRAGGRRGSRRRAAAWIVVVVVLVVLASVAWVGVRAAIAKADLERAVNAVEELRSALGRDDRAAAETASSEAQRSAAHAVEMTGDPVWGAFSAVPIIGDNFSAVRSVARVVDDVATGAVRPLTPVIGRVDFSTIRSSDGRFDLSEIESVRPAVVKATKVLERASSVADAIDTSNTISPVTSAVDRLRGALPAVVAQARAARAVVSLAPPMLGADGERRYLVLFQNNAEVRAGGGSPSALAEITAKDGRISLGRQASSADFPETDRSVLALDTDTEGLYGSITGRYLQDVSLTPRFDTTAKLVRAMWKQRYGDDVDGVLALDPVTLSYILRATGPVVLPTGETLTSDNAVDVLLSEAYAKYPPEAQDAFFAGAAATVFQRLLGPADDPAGIVAAVKRSADEGRVRLWSKNSSEERLISSTAVSGLLPRSDASSQRFGVYFNDATGAKMDYYLEKTVAVGSRVCRRDGRPTWVVEVTLRNAAPADAGTTLPEYVTGGGDYGVSPGDVRTNVVVYSPTSGVFIDARQDGKPAAPHTALDGKYPVVQLQTLLSPGKSSTIRIEFVGPMSAANTAVDARSTPGIHENDTNQVHIRCESPVG